MKTARHARSKGVRALLVTSVFSVGLLAAVVGLRGHYAQFLAGHYRARLATVPDGQAEALLGRVVRLGRPGIPVLVEALASDRDSVAGAGRQTLRDEVARWESLAARESSPRLATLAEALAAQANRFSPEAQTDAANLATQILLWPLDESRVDRGRVIACCERVLWATSGQNRAAHAGPIPGPSHQPEAQAREARTVPRLRFGLVESSEVPLPGVSELSGGGLPVESIDNSPSEPSAASEKLSDDAGESRVADTRVRSPQADDEPRRVMPEPQGAKSILNRPVSSHPDGSGDGDSLRRLAFARETSTAPDEALATDGDSAGHGRIETVEIMRRLQSVNGSEAARRELSRRGFTPVHLEIARQLFDPDPAVRLRLVNRLTRLSSIDPVPWLVQLSKDENAEIRRAAIAVLATTDDSAVLARLERAARADADPAIQRQAEQIARRRSGSLR